ncbi:phosphotransferase family protein [Bacillus timonensis]|uniref:phosphotransferase family protein n=1 Tax=Bacillus timonensis TaxID=1033734 RepID=UPI0002891A59|nr:aminoglycoside phosphotransferase family protein [Bacillus timonensis]
MDRIKESAEFDWVKETISKYMGNTKIKHIMKLGEGWRSKAYLINHTFVFRFPKAEAGAIDTEKEIKVLPYLKNQITLQIPEFIYCGRQDNGFPFVGYKRLQGDPLTEQQLLSLPVEVRNRICDKIAEFINQISSFNVEKARELHVQETNFYHEYLQTFKEVQEKVYPIINKELQTHITSRFTSYLDNKEYFIYTPMLLHSDLSIDHLLFDKQRQELTGIIDFGDMRIGDPDYEYIYLFEECGEEFTRNVMEKRYVKNIPNKLEKVSFFLTFDNVLLLLEGLKSNNHDVMEEAIKIIQDEMRL